MTFSIPELFRQSLRGAFVACLLMQHNPVISYQALACLLSNLRFLSNLALARLEARLETQARQEATKQSVNPSREGIASVILRAS